MTDPEPVPAGGSDPTGESHVELDPAKLAADVKRGAPVDRAELDRAHNNPPAFRSPGEQLPLSRPLADELSPEVLARAIPRHSY